MLQPQPAAPKTRKDLEGLPDNVRAEIIDGVLYVLPKARYRHQHVITAAATDLDPFHRSGGEPGGWLILVEPGIELPRAAEVIPDLAGWRRERWTPPQGQDAIRIVPDWVCEVLSTNRRHDLLVKRPFYAQVGVNWLWTIDIDARSLVVSERVGALWEDRYVLEGDDAELIPPFDAVPISLSRWWEP